MFWNYAIGAAVAALMLGACAAALWLVSSLPPDYPAGRHAADQRREAGRQIIQTEQRRRDAE